MLASVLQWLVGLMTLVITTAVTAATPIVISYLREKALASMNARLGAAAETVAAEMATAVGSALQTQIETGVETIRQRLPETVAKLSPSDETLAGLIKKAQVKLAIPQ